VKLLSRFLQTPGHVLLVQGPPGSGKTSLGLEILNMVEQTHKLYASTRVSPSKLRQDFPWIDEVMDNMTGRTSRGTWIDELHDFRKAEPDTIFNQILRLKHSKRKALLVIDSWEGAVRNTNEEGRRMMESAIFSELDETGVSIIIVNEGRANALDYLVDGIVTVNGSEEDGRKLRMLEVDKLRGFKVSAPRCLFSLEHAHFTQLPPMVLDGDNGKRRMLEPSLHSVNSFSTGSRDLDRVLGGGFHRGAFVLFEVESHVPPQAMRVLLNMIRANFINQEGSCFIAPTGGYSSQSVSDSLRPLIGEEALDQRVRIVEYNPSAPERNWRLMLRGDLLNDANIFLKSWNSLTKLFRNMMVNFDFDKIVQVYGENVALPGFAGIGEGVRDAGALNLGVASRDTELKEEFQRTADYHLKIEMREGTFLISGVKPYTSFYGARFSFTKGYPSLELLEVV
jgi:KaiC/GvpD/RAD55 family RecA-like ATPase